MARSIWSGSISFGLVNIPVKVYPAVRDKRIHFHQIHEKTKCRVRHKLVCPEENVEVPSDEIVKGFEIAPDEYVIVTKEELDTLEPEQTKTIDITDFVDLDSIDPIYYQEPYYVLPDQRAGKAYRLLVTAMINAGKVGIAKFVLRNKESLVALRPLQNVICLEIMRFAEEIVSVDDLEDISKNQQIAEKELKMAQQLIEQLSGTFEPAKYRDEYTEKVRELLDRKAQGEEIVRPHAEEGRAKVIDLMAALEKSLARAEEKKRNKTSEEPVKKRKGKRA
jgi:DNA end-binding protein Ku